MRFCISDSCCPAYLESCVLFANCRILIHQAVIKEQIIQLLCCLDLHNPCPHGAPHQVKPLHALFVCEVVFALTNQLQSANRRTRLFLCIISECVCLGEIISQV